jgi:hypothetical protein
MENYNKRSMDHAPYTIRDEYRSTHLHFFRWMFAFTLRGATECTSTLLDVFVSYPIATSYEFAPRAMVNR